MTRNDFAFVGGVFSIYLGAEHQITALLWSGALLTLLAYFLAPRVPVMFVSVMPPNQPPPKEPPTP